MNLSSTYLYRLTFGQELGADITSPREREECQLKCLVEKERTRTPCLEGVLESSLQGVKRRITKVLAYTSVHDLF